MKIINCLLLLIVISTMVGVVQAEELQYETVTKMAEDSNCADCHDPDPHTIHESTSATCQQCHGATLTDRQPPCNKCHTGTIHNVHIKKVQTEDCSFCHTDLDSFHSDMISDTLCSHCHDDLLDVHGGGSESCDACHFKASEIVSPVTSAGDIIVCQNCHISADVAAVHGEPSNVSSCYLCHRPGASEVESLSEIPHFLHIPEVDCNSCHLSQETGKIYLPECIQCHSVEKLHGYNTIALKTSATGLKCSVCHPMVSSDDNADTPSSASTPDAVEPTEDIAEGDGSSGIPGFGIVTALTALTALYVINRNRN
ncbi:MAG: hypothetical protein KAR85_06835 [Methanosarcinales archaeon]|nr:hypothetical protein [Methanosarcinales archaeon]